MNLKIVVLAITILISVQLLRAEREGIEPANPNATRETRQLLN